MKNEHANQHAMRLTWVVAVGLVLLQSGCSSPGAPGQIAPLPMFVQQERKEVSPPVQASDSEISLGIQVLQVGMSGGGGLVDVRFKVLDSAKARALLGKAANSPELLVDQAPPLVAPHHALRGARLNRGEVFYILFPNARASVKAGVDVTVAMGEARLGPVRVQ